MENGALGSGISGSGPSIFALKEETPDTKFKSHEYSLWRNEVAYEIHVSKVNPDGMRIL
jgi:homoserine kinase